MKKKKIEIKWLNNCDPLSLYFNYKMCYLIIFCKEVKFFSVFL